MSDFEDIPAVGDASVDEEREDTPSENSVMEGNPGGKFRFNGKHIYVTWSRSKIDEKEVFHQKLLAILPPGVRLFGGRELHKDGTPHYHVVMSFLHKVNYPDAVKKFSIEGDTNAIRLEKPKSKQGSTGFLKNRMAYCAKDGNTFGERLFLQKKRKSQEIIDETDERSQGLEEPRIVSTFSRARRGTTHDRLTVKQGEAKVEQVVQVGKRLFAELGERTTLLEAEVQLYREAVIALARRAGVEVPAFARAESGGAGKGGGGNVEELRA
jgi:hypothetical protein